MRSLSWVAGCVVTVAVTALAGTAVSLELAALTGLVWGVVAWTNAGYPETRSLTYEGLAGRDRWLAAASLGLAAAAFAGPARRRGSDGDRAVRGTAGHHCRPPASGRAAGSADL